MKQTIFLLLASLIVVSAPVFSGISTKSFQFLQQKEEPAKKVDGISKASKPKKKSQALT